VTGKEKDEDGRVIVTTNVVATRLGLGEQRVAAFSFYVVDSL